LEIRKYLIENVCAALYFDKVATPCW